jgi:hypothetical protein
MNQFEQMLSKWGFGTPRDGSKRSEADLPAPRDPYRDVAQVKQMLNEGITPAMLLEHPYIRLSVEARAYLEKL